MENVCSAAGARGRRGKGGTRPGRLLGWLILAKDRFLTFAASLLPLVAAPRTYTILNLYS